MVMMVIVIRSGSNRGRDNCSDSDSDSDSDGDNYIDRDNDVDIYSDSDIDRDSRIVVIPIVVIVIVIVIVIATQLRGTRQDPIMINEGAKPTKVSNIEYCGNPLISPSAFTEIERVVPWANSWRHVIRLTLRNSYLSIFPRIF